jgi:hypothetical protein
MDFYMLKNSSHFFTLLVKSAVGLAVIFCVFYLISIFFTESNILPVIEHHPAVVVKKDAASKLPIVSSKKNSTVIPDTESYQYCEQLVKEHRSDGYDWARQEYKNWTKYLSNGYSLNEVTLAVEYFANSNFAAEFRIKQLRRTSTLANENSQLNEKLQDYLATFPEHSFGQFIRIAVPSAELENYEILSKEERSLLLEHTIPTVDDIAFFIGQATYTDSDIIELLNAISDPAATVGYEAHKAISLLDYAVQASRVEVVKKLLILDLKPTIDEYLGSTMEWALSRLTYANTAEQRQASATIVNMLANLGAKARFEEKELSKISGSFPHHFYEFDEQKIEALMQDYGLDLTTIESRDTIHPDKKSPLITILTKQQAIYLAEQLGIDNPKVEVAACNQTLERVNNAWQPERADIILKRIVAANSNSPEMIKELLSAIDPSLVDCYQKEYNSYMRPQEYVDNADQYFRPLKDKNVLAVIDDFLTLPLNDANKNWLFSQILMWDASYYDELYNSELMVDELQYFSFNDRMLSPISLNKLAQANVNLHSSDSLGKTLLFYAVKKWDIKLLHYMSEQQIPFSLSDTGQDPLHIILDSAHYLFTNNKVIDIVDILMKYHPKIDQFHLSRMALLKLKYPLLYLQLIESYPQLKVKPETGLPRTICHTNYF